MNHVRVFSLCLCAFVSHVATAQQSSPGRDNAIVESLLRIPDAKIDTYPQHSDAIKRYLKTVTGTTQYLRVVGQLDLIEEASNVSTMVNAIPVTTKSTQAANWLYEKGRESLVEAAVANTDDEKAAAAISALGYLNSKGANELLLRTLQHSNRSRIVRTPDQAAWANRVFGEAYRADLAGLKESSERYPDEIEFVQSCIKGTAEKYDDGRRYDSLAQYTTIKSLFDAANKLGDEEIINVLCWGSLTEPAILVAHCLPTNDQSLLKKLRFIAHWTDSPLHQGTPEHPERVANCQEDAAACRYMKSMVSAGKIVYYECGAIGQHGIVSGSPKGSEYFDRFRTSRLGTLFVEGRYVQNCVDHSDSATYWVLLGEYGVSLQDIAADGTNSSTVEKANETKFAKASKQIHDQLLLRSSHAGENEL